METIFIADNRERILLADDMEEYRLYKPDWSLWAFEEIGKHLRIPVERLSLIEINEDLRLMAADENNKVQLDETIFGQIEYGNIFQPIGVLRYVLLLQLLGIQYEHQYITFKPGNRFQFVFFNRRFDPAEINSKQFERNPLFDLIIKKMSRDNLENEFQAFAVLFDQKFKDKFIQSLIRYQTKSGEQLNKKEITSQIMDEARIKALKDYIFTIKEKLRR